LCGLLTVLLSRQVEAVNLKKVGPAGVVTTPGPWDQPSEEASPMASLSPPVPRVKPAPEARGSCRWVLGSARQRLDLGSVAPLEIRREGYAPQLYLVRLNRDPGTGGTLGYRLERADTGALYDLPADLSDCTCPDAAWRPRPGGCKHQRALRAALAALAL
jgi:hypothetical protein